MSTVLEKIRAKAIATPPSADVCSTSKQGHTILRLPEVMEKTKLACPSVYRQVKAGTFPAPISLGERAVGWIESEIDAWIEKRMQARYADASPSM